MRVGGWLVFVLWSVLRPGVDALDRWLVSPAWNIPSAWNAVADVAIKEALVDSRIAGAPAPWRRASILPVRSKKIAVVTVSDLRHSRTTFLSETYTTLGVFTRTTTDPALVTDEARGYAPLTHVWPILDDGDRIMTLVAFAPLRSGPPTQGMFAYLAVGPHDTELLFLGLLRRGRNSVYGLLDRALADNSGPGNIVLRYKGLRDRAPIATFSWNPARREYAATVTAEAQPLVSWWATSPANRLVVRSDESVDEAIGALAARLAAPD